LNNDGIYYLNASAIDILNRTGNTETRSITIDTIYPLITYNSGTLSEGTNISQGNIYVNVSVTELNEANITFSLFDDSFSLLNSTTYSNFTRAINWTNLSTGVFYYNVTLTDLAGNSNTTVSRKITLDLTFPDATLSSPLNGSYNNITSVNFTVTINDQDNLGIKNATLNIYNSTNLINQTSVVNLLSSTLGIVVSLVDGVYNWFYSLFDYAENRFVTSNNTLTVDTLNPTINFSSPTETSGVYFARGNIIVNVTSTDANLKNITINLYNSSRDLINSTNSSSSPIFNNFTGLSDGIYYFNATAYDFAGWKNSTETRNATLDTTYPWIDYGTGTLNAGINISQNNVYINVTVTEINEANITFRIFNSTSQVNITTLSAGNRFINFTNLSDGTYRYNVSVSDLAGNTNTTATRTITLGLLPPRIYNITYSPNSSDRVDPGANLTFNVTIISGSLADINTVILSYNNGSGWINLTLNNISSNVYSGNITLIGTETNYSYFIFANDSVGNSNVSSTSSFSSYWDCSWTLTPATFGGISGFNENKNLGSMIINNTGDIAFTSSNCSLDFYVTSNLPGRVYYDSSYFPLYTTLSAGTSRTISVNATFLNEAKSESLIITTNESNGISSTISNNVTATLVTVTGNQPYLFEAIESHPNNVALLNGQFALSGYVRNLVGDGSQAKAARNVSFNWTLPASFTILNGNASLNYPIILDNEIRYNNLNITLNSANLPSMSPGVYTIYLYAYGYNQSGDRIVMYGNSTLLNETATITFSCSNISDGIVVTACGSLDGDYSAPVTPPVVITTGGGGETTGGGGGQVVYSQIISLVRGQSDSFTIKIRNDKNATLENLKLLLIGFDSKYIKFSPDKIDVVNPGETKYFTVTISSPKYKSYEEHTLQAIITGDSILGNVRGRYLQTENIKLIIQEIALNNTEINLAEAEKAIADMAKAGLNTEIVNGLLIEARNKLNQSRNKEAFDIANEIILTKQRAFLARETITLVLDSIKNPKKIKELTGAVAINISREDDLQYVNLSIDFLSIKMLFRSKSAEDMISLAIAAFERGDYELAQQRADAAKALLILERKGNFILFLYLYWQYILISAIVLALIGFVAYRAYQRSSIFQRIFSLDREESNIKNLIIKAQESYFLGKTSVTDYHRRLEEYNKRLAEIKSSRITLRNRRIRMLKPEEIAKELNLEKNQVEAEIAKTQKQFYRDKSIPESSYKEEFKMLNERLAEIEDENLNLQFTQKLKEPSSSEKYNKKVHLSSSNKNSEKILKKSFFVDKSKINIFKRFFKKK
jgi:hypothetical protein